MSESSVHAEEPPPNAGAYHATPASEHLAVVRDARGWVYRLFADSPECRVVEIGDGFAENWLPHVVKADLRAQTVPTPSGAQFDLVVMHYSLGGAATLGAAIESASCLLRRGGVLAIAGQNRLRASDRCAPDGVAPPRATAWGFRSAMTAGGFSRVALYIAHPPGNAPVYVVDANRLSARDFFRKSLATRRLSPWSPVRIASRALVELNVMPYLQPGLLVVGEKC